MKLAITFALLLVTCPQSRSQITLNAGASTLFDAVGAGATIYRPNGEIAVGATYQDGHFIPGASYSFDWKDQHVTVGNQGVGYGFDGAGIGFSCLCISVRRKKPAKRLQVSFFSGMIGRGISSPWSQASIPSQPGAGVLLTLHLKGLTLSSIDAFGGGSHTLAQGASYQYKTFRAIAATGLIDGKTFFEAAAAVSAGPINFTANHSSFFVPVTSTGDGLSVTAHASIFNVSASVNETRSLGVSANGESGSIGAKLWNVSEQTSILHSGDHNFIVQSVSERINQRISLMQMLTEQNSSRNLAFGGAYHGNKISLSVNENYQLWIRGWVRVTSIGVSFRIRDLVISGQTISDAAGQTKWTASTTTFLQSDMSHLGPRTTEGKYVLEGSVTDTEGNPVQGAAIEIVTGKKKSLIFSNVKGMFQQNVPKKEITIRVALEEFESEGWIVVSTPTTVKAGEPVKIVVKRK